MSYTCDIKFYRIILSLLCLIYYCQNPKGVLGICILLHYNYVYVLQVLVVNLFVVNIKTFVIFIQWCSGKFLLMET